jgi:hypothetical protein
MAQHVRCAARWADQTKQHPDQCRLPRAVGPYQARDSTAGNLHRQIVNGDQVTEPAGQPIGSDHTHGHPRM